MAKKIRVGIIGAGGISRLHVEGYQKCPGVEVVATCDIDRARAQAQAEQFHIPHAFDSHTKLLRLKEIDAVSVCTPNHAHCAPAVAALKAGKHVLVEKPIAMDARQAQRMVDAARKARRQLQVGLDKRFSSGVQFARQVISEGHIGKPYYARALSIRRRGVPSWGVFGQKKLQGGGALIDIGVHSMDMAWYLMGCPKPLSVSGKAYRTIGDTPGHVGMFGPWDPKTYDVEDFAVALVRFAGGATMMIESAFCVNLDKDLFGCTVVGEKGGVTLDPLTVHMEVAGHLMDCTPNHVQRVQSHHAEVAAFIDAIRRGTSVLVPAHQAIWVQKMMDAIYASSKAGKEVRIR